MENNAFKITNDELDNLQEVFDALHSPRHGDNSDTQAMEVYPPARDSHPDPGYPSNRISQVLNSVSVANIGVANIDGLAKLFMTVYCDAELKAKVDKAREFLLSLISEQVVTEWKPIFPGLRSRRYFKFCIEATSENDRLLLFYHGKWRPVTRIEEQEDSNFAICYFDNPYSETREVRPTLQIQARYDSIYIVAFKELQKLIEAQTKDREFFGQWLSAAMKIARVQKERFISIGAMYANPVLS